MGIEFSFGDFNLAGLLQLADQGPLAIGLFLFLNGGWIIISVLLLRLLYEAWLEMRQGKYAAAWKHVILAIDIPRNNEQTPKAVESIFMALAGSYTTPNKLEKFWLGKVQESFSFEIVSLEGYVQFVIRTPAHFRDLIEAAVYAQYPDAEITEVDDYAAPFAALKFPHPQYNLWGTDMVLTKDYPYPIRTYAEFEHQMSMKLIDPIGGLLEIFSRLNPGEQIWMQYVITPIPPSWGDGPKRVISAIKGDAPKSSGAGIFDLVSAPFAGLFNLVGEFTRQIFGAEMGIEGAPAAPEKPAVKQLGPGEQDVMRKIQNKISKAPLMVKCRLVYFGDKAVFNKGRGVAAVMGALQQFGSADANGLKPGKSKTAANYFRVAQRLAEKQNAILQNYIMRHPVKGDPPLLLNAEELATLWHFPQMTVKAQSIEMIAAKKLAPPSRLPYEDREAPSARPAPVAVQSAAMPPPHLPMSDAGPVAVPAPPAIMPEIPESTARPVAQPPVNLPTIE